MHYWSKIVNCDFGFVFCRGQKGTCKSRLRLASDRKDPKQLDCNYLSLTCAVNNHEGSIPFTRSIDNQALAKKCK